MAKKKQKKAKSRTTRRRRSTRRVSGIGMVGGLPLETLAGIAGGAIASKALNGIAKNIKPLQKNPKILPIIKVVAGGYMVAKGSPTMQNIGTGVLAEGALDALEVFAPNVFKKMKAGYSADSVDGIGTTLIDLDDYNNLNGVGSANYYYEEDHTVGSLQNQDYALGAV